MTKRPELKVGEFVTLNDYKNSTGGIIYRIAVRGEPVTPAFTSIHVTRKEWIPLQGKLWSPKIEGNGNWIQKQRLEHGNFNENKKKIPLYKVNGFLRLRPVFEFYPTHVGSNPKGLGGTVLINSWQFDTVKHVTLLELAQKYAEFGKLIQNVVSMRSEFVDSSEIEDDEAVDEEAEQDG